MKICILQADTVNKQFQPRHGDYPQMIGRILKKAAAEIGENLFSETYDVVEEKYPASIRDYDGYVISGSRKSIYEDDLWISQLRRFILSLHNEKTPLVGICFGHQLIADELGGVAESAENGWGVGAHEYKIISQHWCMSPRLEKFRVLVSHKDQVTRLPKGAVRLARSDFCANAMFSIDNHIFALQGHPEFLPAYSEELMKWRREIIGEALYHSGIASLEHDLQSPEIAQWIVHFLKGDRSV